MNERTRLLMASYCSRSFDFWT